MRIKRTRRFDLVSGVMVSESPTPVRSAGKGGKESSLKTDFAPTACWVHTRREQQRRYIPIPKESLPLHRTSLLPQSRPASTKPAAKQHSKAPKPDQ